MVCFISVNFSISLRDKTKNQQNGIRALTPYLVLEEKPWGMPSQTWEKHGARLGALGNWKNLEQELKQEMYILDEHNTDTPSVLECLWADWYFKKSDSQA